MKVGDGDFVLLGFGSGFPSLSRAMTSWSSELSEIVMTSIG